MRRKERHAPISVIEPGGDADATADCTEASFSPQVVDQSEG